MVVDDDIENRRLLKTLLTQTGFIVREAVDGSSALKQFDVWHPHLIWMDMRMPVMDGYEATRLIRAKPGGAEVKIIALTASVFHEQYQAIKTIGCDDILFKPFKAHEIFTAMEQHLGVEFEFAVKTKWSPKNKVNKKLTAADLIGLPKQWRDELQHAAISLDLEQANEVIAHIAKQDLKLSENLTSMVDNYEFDRLQALFEPNTGFEVKDS